MSQSTLSKQDYESFRDFLEDACGIVLGENKHYLVTSRLTRLLDEFNCATLGGMIEKLKSPSSSDLKGKIIDAMTTNETSWFRDKYPFEVLYNELFNEFAKTKQPRLRIWSAASSSGQEAYSISMVFSEYQRKNPGKFTGQMEVVGTDISPTVLNLAREAKYDELSLSRGLSPERLKLNFTNEGDGGYKVRPEVSSRCKFSELNLLKNYSILGKFDIIFCRNVLIYFSAEIKTDILTRMAKLLNPGGYLFLGGSESPTGYCNLFEMVKLSNGVVYRLK